MRKVTLFVLALLILSLIFTSAHLGAAKRSIFEETSQKNAARTSLNLEGGYVEDIAIAPNGTVYAATNSPNGIFRSTNSQTWQGPSGSADMGSPIAVEVDSSSNAYVIAGIDLYKSTNNGVSWTKLSLGRGDYDQTLLYAQGKLIAPSRNGSVDISSNGGSSFTNVMVVSGQRIRSLASSTSGVFFAIVGEGAGATVYRSTDSGASWSSTGKIGNYTVVGANSSGTVVIAGPPGAQYSTDNGSNWNSMGNPSGAGHVTFSGSRVYIGNSWTNDNGATWHNLENEAVSKTSILRGNAFAVNSTNSNLMFINSGRGVAKSADGGANWTDIYDSMHAVTVDTISQANNKNVVWLATNGGLAKTTNFTAANPTWTFPILPTLSFIGANAVWVNPGNPNIVLAGANEQIYRSTDGGSAWSFVGFPSTAVTSFEASSDNSVIYASLSSSSGDTLDGGVLKSTDGGSTWSNTGLGQVPVTSLAIGSDGSVYAGAGREFDTTPSTRGIYKYNGSSWSQLSGTPSSYLINDLLIVGSSIFAAGGETNKGGVFVSRDGGASWAQLTKGLPGDGWFKALAYENGTSTLYVSTGRPAGTSYIYKSMDGGASWGLFYTGLKDEAFNDLLFDGLVGGSDTGLYSYKSKASLGIAAYKRIIKKYKRKGKIRKKVVHVRVKKARRGQLVRLKITLADATTKKKLKSRVVLLYKKIIVKRKAKGKWRRIGKWKRIKKVRLNKQGYTFINTRFSKSVTYLATWKPISKRDKTSYKSANSKSLKVR